MDEREERWQRLFQEIFSDFPDQRILLEARKTLEAIGYCTGLENGTTVAEPGKKYEAGSD